MFLFYPSFQCLSILAVLLRLVLILRQLTKKVTQIETCDRVQYFLMLLINYILLYVLNKIEVFFFLKWLFFTMQADLRIVYLPDNGIHQGGKDFINVRWQYQLVHKYSIYVSPLKCSDVIRWIKHLISCHTLFLSRKFIESIYAMRRVWSFLSKFYKQSIYKNLLMSAFLSLTARLLRRKKHIVLQNQNFECMLVDQKTFVSYIQFIY